MLTAANALTLFVFSCLFVLCCLAYLARAQNKAIAVLEERLEDLTEQVGFDDLTGVYRRTAGERRMRLALRTMPCIVGFIDLRDFGLINKTKGWEAGDTALVDLCEALSQHYGREHDTIYRYGGDEFVLVLAALPRKTELPLVATFEVGEQPAPEDYVAKMFDHAERVLGELAEGPVKFDWALEISSRVPGDDPSTALRNAMEAVRITKENRKALEAAHAALENENGTT